MAGSRAAGRRCHPGARPTRRAPPICSTWRPTQSDRAVVGGVSGPLLSTDLVPAAHADWLMTLFGFLMREGKLPVDFLCASGRACRQHRRRTSTRCPTASPTSAPGHSPPTARLLADPAHWQCARAQSKDAPPTRCTSGSLNFSSIGAPRADAAQRDEPALETTFADREVVVEGHVMDWLTASLHAQASSPAPRQGAGAAAQKVLAFEIDARAAGSGRRPTSSSCWRPRRQPLAVPRSAGSWRRRKCSSRACASSADEPLPAPRRDAVQQRSTSGSRPHRKFLGPSIQLPLPEDITGIARLHRVPAVRRSWRVWRRHKVARM